MFTVRIHRKTYRVTINGSFCWNVTANCLRLSDHLVVVELNGYQTETYTLVMSSDHPGMN